MNIKILELFKNARLCWMEDLMFEEFPELKQIIEEQDEFEKSKYEAAKSAIDILTQ